MPYPLSDEESSDSDNGVRFKTTNTRDKFKASSSSTSFNTKSYKNNFKESFYGNSCKPKYDIDNINHKELKSKGSSKYRYENATSRRKEDKYRCKTSESSHSSIDCKVNKGCTNDSHLNYKRKNHDIELNINNDCDNRNPVSTKCIKEKDKIGKKFSSPVKNITNSINYSQQDDLLTSAKIITDNEDIILELQPKSKMSNISSADSKIKNKAINSKIYEKQIYFGPSMPGKYTVKSKNTNPQIQENQISKLSKYNTSLEIDCVIEGDKEKYFGPSLPPKINIMEENNISCDSLNIYGPSIPPHLKNYKYSEPTNLCKNKGQDSDDLCDPILHHHENIEKNSVSEICINRCKVIGPNLPNHLKVSLVSESDSNIDTTNEIKTSISNSEDCVIGPIPMEHYLNTQLEERALQIKLDLLNKTVKESTSREEWMLELPEIHAVTQVTGPRKFRKNELPDLNDRSVWTDIVKDKTKKNACEKVDIKLEANIKNIREKDLIQDKIVEKQKNNKRPKSLIDMHNEELQNKKLKNNSVTDERRPFSRDVDLKINRFDEAQTKAIIKKAHLLDNKFASGQSKFL